MIGSRIFLSRMDWSGPSGTALQLASSPPKVWADAYILGFAAAAGLKVVTFDRALKARGQDVLLL